MNATKNPHYGCRQKAEDRAGELNSALSSTQKAYQNEINALKKKTKEQREKIDVLNNQVRIFLTGENLLSKFVSTVLKVFFELLLDISIQFRGRNRFLWLI